MLPPSDHSAPGANAADPREFEALRLAYDRLQQQYHALAAFLGTASHELRAPINQVISLHQLILEDLCESPDEEREFIAQANQAIAHILKNLDTVIALSKLDIGALEPAHRPIPLGKVLATVQRFTTMQCINRQCRLTVNPGPDPPQVLSDEAWLTQALLSLVESALVVGSSAISLEVGGAGRETDGGADQAAITLTLTCQGSASPWPPPTLPPPNPADTPEPSHAAAFRYHLAQRLLAHLQGSMRPVPSTSPDEGILLIALPASDSRV